ncbi:hypothetical protein DFP72DRAFT_59716 [Ephemerocybe angulata]|uniref:F-box domain-containing protein n=1 Tax=Ephemerocybe angulata TaxID=980116 RepID=A0A8H6HDT0_9AGAR|nr:hypothetical protein DFP72DRAFT_59716 [Tulosesus angulatus]
MKGKLKSRFSHFFGRRSVSPEPPPAHIDVGKCAIEVLPNELLAAIFSFNARRTQSSFIDILSISHTCQRWRNAALACPELWRRYAFLHRTERGPRTLEFTRTILERCGDLSLDIGWERLHRMYHLPSTTKYHPDTLEVEAMSRTRSFSARISSKTHEMLAPLQQKQDPPTKCLEELSLDSGDLFSFRNIASALLAEAPLKSLQLRSCWLDLSTIRTDHLQVFEIALPSFTLSWGADEWMFFLACCPNLISLSMSLNQPNSYDVQKDTVGKSPTRDVRLPKLTELNLRVSHSLLQRIVSRAVLPSLRTVALEVPNTTFLPSEALHHCGKIIEGIINQLIIPVLHKDPAAGGTPRTQGNKTRDTRMQISISNSRYVYLGFTPSGVAVQTCSRSSDLDSEEDEFRVRSSFPKSSPPNDWVQVAIKEGGSKLSELLAYWVPVASYISNVHVEVPAENEHGVSLAVASFLQHATLTYQSTIRKCV